jgi:hypothetical protein
LLLVDFFDYKCQKNIVLEDNAFRLRSQDEEKVSTYLKMIGE